MFLCAESIRHLIDSIDLVDDISDESVNFIEGSAVDLSINEIYRIDSSKAAFIGRDRNLPTAHKWGIINDVYELPCSFEIVRGSIGEDVPYYTIRTTLFIIQSRESVKLPSYLGGIIYPRTSFFNAGVDVLCSRISPGFEGKLRTGLVVYHNQGIKLEKYARFASVMFHKFTAGSTDTYKGIWGGDKVTTSGVERGF